MSQLADVDRFITEARKVEGPVELHALVADITTEMGFDMYALIHHVDLTGMRSDLAHMKDGRMVAVSSYPPDWIETYVTRNLVATDPAVLASHRSPVGFRWEDMPKLIKMTQAHRDVLSAAGRHGVGGGFTIPAHVPGEANGTCHFAVRKGRAVPEGNLLMAQLVGGFAFQAAREMVLKQQRVGRRPVKLTSRQMECLVLAARGKSDWEIGQILGIGEDSVKYHMKQVRERYEVPTRIQAAFRSLFDGEIALADVIER